MFGIGSAITPYVIGGAILAAAVLTTGGYVKGRMDGREAVLQRLQDDRIAVFKDGVKIDNDVLAADSDELCQMLGGCL